MPRLKQGTPRCASCKWWSDLIARANGAGLIEALCLNPQGSKYRQFTRAAATCAAHQQGPAIDEPPDDPRRP